jgi:hypothetical protein
MNEYSLSFFFLSSLAIPDNLESGPGAVGKSAWLWFKDCRTRLGLVYGQELVTSGLG